MSLARQGKTPNFEEVAVTKKNEEKKESTSIEEIVNTVIERPKGIPKKQVSIYLDVDVAKEFEKFGKRNGKGSKSELVNNFLKQVFEIER